jgi:hypothetical protein
MGAGNSSLHHRVQNGSGIHPSPIQWVPGALSLGVKRPGREADHLPPSSAEVKGRVELHLHSPNTPSWHGAQLKHRDKFTFTYLKLFVSYRHQMKVIYGVRVASILLFHNLRNTLTKYVYFSHIPYHVIFHDFFI